MLTHVPACALSLIGQVSLLLFVWLCVAYLQVGEVHRLP